MSRLKSHFLKKENKANYKSFLVVGVFSILCFASFQKDGNKSQVQRVLSQSGEHLADISIDGDQLKEIRLYSNVSTESIQIIRLEEMKISTILGSKLNLHSDAIYQTSSIDQNWRLNSPLDTTGWISTVYNVGDYYPHRMELRLSPNGKIKQFGGYSGPDSMSTIVKQGRWNFLHAGKIESEVFYLKDSVVSTILYK